MLEMKKKEFIDELNQRVEDKILNKANAEFLAKLISKADSLEEVQAIMAMGTTYKRTGFHFDFRKEPACSNIKYLKKNEKLSFVTDKDALTHKLIIGDNYDALRQLLITHRGLIDVIYIDPPYGKDNLGKFADTNYTNSITRDNLLSMLYIRLQLAKSLLAEDGIVCVSIDDKNQAYVKCLMDEIFGEGNFVANCPRKSAGARTTKSKHELQIIHDYVLVYRHNENDFLTQRIKGEKKYPFEDERGKYYTVPLQDNGPHGTRSQRPNLWYPLYQKEDGTVTLDETDKVFYPKMHKHEEGCWMWSKRKVLAEGNDLIIENGEVKIKHYYVDGEDTNKYEAFSSWIDKHQNSSGTKMLNSILGVKTFDNPKPVELVKYLINLCSNKNAIVLDFFAGSGTTGQAVLDLNREDGGSRQFILCTNNETTELNPNGIAYDVTAKRLRRILAGKCYDGFNDFEWLEKNKPYGDNLVVTEIAEISPTIADKDNTPFDIIDESLYDILPFDKREDKINWICTYFKNTMKGIESDKKYCERWGE